MLPLQPTLRIEPALNADRIEPALPNERMEPALARDRIDPALNADRIEPALASDPIDPMLPRDRSDDERGVSGECMQTILARTAACAIPNAQRVGYASRPTRSRTPHG